MINILVTGVGSLLGQGIIKTIKKSNIKINIFGTDYFETAVGLYWVKKGYLLPDVLKKNNFKNWFTKFIYICRKEKIDIIIPGLDFETPILSKYKTVIEKKTKSKILVSPINVIKTCNDKWETIEFLKKNNFLYPKSCLPKNINKFLTNNKFPLIVKPRFESTSKNISIVKNINELKKSLINCKKPIIQEIVGKKKNEYTCGSTLINGKILSTITLKRELKDGNTKIAFHNKMINLDNFLCDVTKKLKPYGQQIFN